MTKNNRDLKELKEEAEAEGWSVTITNGCHYRWQHPNGGFFFSAYTPGDRRVVMNIRRDMRRVASGYYAKRAGREAPT